MATDDERREVARRLRSFVTDDSMYADVDACDVLYSIGLYYKDIDRIYFSGSAVARLADLIEPEPERTYHPERVGTAYHSALMCSACKYSLDEVTVYCPHCGARLEGVSHGKR